MSIELRRIIDGKVYDTTTAKWVASIASRGSANDFRREHTDLYLSPRGNWFLAGEGGPMSRWRRRTRDEDGYTDGEGLALVDADEARRLLEEVDGPVEDYFAVEEG